MTARDDYPSHEQTFAAADGKIELAQQLMARAEPVVEGDAAWLYLTKTRRLPADKVRAALSELRLITPLIEGRAASDYGVASLLRDRDGEISGLQLAFVDVTGAPSAKQPKRQTYALREHGVRDATFRAGGGPGDVAYICEGYLEKALAVAALGIGPVYGAGGRAILGCAPPPEPKVVLVTDRRPDDTVVDIKTGLTAADLHDRDYKRAADLLLLAGKAVSVTPDPPVCAHGCKDADDVLVKHGAILLEEWIRRAQPVDSLSLDGEARRCAGIADPLERDREVSATARRLKVRVGEFREAVRRHRDGEADREPEDVASGSALTFDLVVPATDPQDGAQLLDDLDAAIRRHAFITPTDRTKAVLWSVHNHRRFLNNVSVLPRLIITAPGEDSGKSTLAATLAHLGDTMEHLTDPTAAVIFRAIEACGCGFMLDEVDGWWFRDEGLRSILNSGFTLEGARVSRIEDVGSGSKRVLAPRRYSTFAPIASVGIKLDTMLPRTLVSRSLVIRMTPARVGEVPEEIFGNRVAVARLHTLAGRIKRWIADNELALSVADPKLPAELINRIRLVWRPLFAIADQAGGSWPQRALEALTADRGERQDPSLAEQLLLDLRDVIRVHGFGVGSDRAAHTRDAITHLIGLEERTWGVFGKARDAIRDFEVSKLLAPYRLAPKQIQAGGRGGPNRRGYRLADVEAAIARFISVAPLGAARQLDQGKKPVEGAEDVDFSTSGPLLDGSLDDPTVLDEDSFGDGLAARLASGPAAIHEQDQRSSGLAPSRTPYEEVNSLGAGNSPEPSTEDVAFTPTTDWQDLPPGAILPPGLEITARGSCP